MPPDRADIADPYFAPWERHFERIRTPFEDFVHRTTSGGIVLAIATVIALILANGPLAEPYLHLLHVPLSVTLGPWTLDHSLQHWINDGLMALFFFVVGLEIKREILAGDLADPRAAALPLVAAVGGMVVPALLYAAFNAGGPGSAGWGVPMATDIAFAVGALALLGSRTPRSLLTFLVALAIVDDLGAVAVIAVFYTAEIDLNALGAALAMLGIAIALNRAGVRSTWAYAIVGALMWLAMLNSGVHATIAGILTAWAVPTRPKIAPRHFSTEVRALLDRFDTLGRSEPSLVHNERQRALIQAIEHGVHQVESPLQRMEHALHTPVAFMIIPLFALANAAVPIELGTLGTALVDPVTLGIVSGLVLGKTLGIAGAALLAVRLGWARMPEGCSRGHIVGVGLLGGIGFTMSIFIAELGLGYDQELLLLAKTGILLASLLAGVAGYVMLARLGNPSKV